MLERVRPVVGPFSGKSHSDNYFSMLSLERDKVWKRWLSISCVQHIKDIIVGKHLGSGNQLK